MMNKFNLAFNSDINIDQHIQIHIKHSRQNACLKKILFGWTLNGHILLMTENISSFVLLSWMKVLWIWKDMGESK